MLKKSIIAIAAILLVAPAAIADDHGDHGDELHFEVVSTGLSSATFQSDAMLETITGTTVSVHGDIHTKLEDPSATRADLRVDATTLRTGNDLRDEHLGEENWLNTGEHPHIVFDLREVSVPEGSTLQHGQTLEATATGSMSIRGTTRDVEIPVRVTFFEIDDDEIAETMGVESNLLRLVSDFTVELSDYGINIPSAIQAKLANEISVNMRITAAQQ